MPLVGRLGLGLLAALSVSGALKGSIGDHLSLNPHPLQLVLGRVDFGDPGRLFIGQPCAPTALGFLVHHEALSHDISVSASENAIDVMSHVFTVRTTETPNPSRQNRSF